MLYRISFALAAFVSLVVALTSYRFVALGLEASFPEMAAHITGARLAFVAHIVGAPVALAIGAAQFVPAIRVRMPALHRWTGRLYALAILVAGFGALGMLPTSNGGVVAQIGFGLLALAWLGTTAYAVRLAMSRRIAEHQRWMVRSFALTFAAVTLRIYLVAMVAAGMEYVDAIAILAWACWVPNLIVAEWILRKGRYRPASGSGATNSTSRPRAA